LVNHISLSVKYTKILSTKHFAEKFRIGNPENIHQVES
jgi:hypothetical protein